jgi:hypothetical protein
VPWRAAERRCMNSRRTSPKKRRNGREVDRRTKCTFQNVHFEEKNIETYVEMIMSWAIGWFRELDASGDFRKCGRILWFVGFFYSVKGRSGLAINCLMSFTTFLGVTYDALRNKGTVHLTILLRVFFLRILVRALGSGVRLKHLLFFNAI